MLLMGHKPKSMVIAKRISVTIPSDVLEEIRRKVSEGLELARPYLVTVPITKKIHGMAKLGRKIEPFVENGLEFTLCNSWFMPFRGNAAEAINEFKYFSDMRPLIFWYNSLESCHRTAVLTLGKNR